MFIFSKITKGIFHRRRSVNCFFFFFIFFGWLWALNLFAFIAAFFAVIWVILILLNVIQNFIRLFVADGNFCIRVGNDLIQFM